MPEIRRFYTYTDADGVHWAAVAKTGTEMARTPVKTLLKDMVKHLSGIARTYKWTNVELVEAELPQDEIMRRSNAINEKNGEPPRWSDEEIALVSKPTITNIVTVAEDGKKTNAAVSHDRHGLPTINYSDIPESPLSALENELHENPGIVTPTPEAIIDPTAPPVVTMA